VPQGNFSIENALRNLTTVAVQIPIYSDWQFKWNRKRKAISYGS